MWSITKPGAGWTPTGKTKKVDGVTYYYWSKGGGTPATPGDNNNSGDNPNGNGNDSNSSASGDAGDLQKRIDQWTSVYRAQTGIKGKLSAEALAVIKYAASFKTGFSATDFMDRIRTKDPEGYLETRAGGLRIKEMDDLLKGIYGTDYDAKDPKMKALRIKYAIGDPQDKGYFGDLFKKFIMRSDLFIEKYGNFAKYLRTSKALGVDFSDPLKSFSIYLTARNDFAKSYKQVFGAAATIPPGLLDQAMLGGWDLDSAEWREAIANDTNWGNVVSYQERVDLFKEQWKAIFGTSEFGDLDPPPDLMKKFGQMTGEPNGDFNKLFHTSIKDSQAFQMAFPDYAEYEQATVARLGVLPASISISDYLGRRGDYIERYKYLMEDANAVPSPELLAQALSNNWSDTQWDLTIKKEVPEYKETGQFKNKAASFDSYWRRVFGEASTPDAGLREQFVEGSYTDASALWDEIKSTSEFRSQYAMWDTFAAAQNAQGNDVSSDPGEYKKYQKAFYDAFANQGLQVGQGFDRMFLASGIDTQTFAQNLQTYNQAEESFTWQSGQKADVATAAGIADKTAGGKLRQGLSQAIQQHKAYAQSKYQTFENQKVGDTIAQKV